MWSVVETSGDGGSTRDLPTTANVPAPPQHPELESAFSQHTQMILCSLKLGTQRMLYLKQTVRGDGLLVSIATITSDHRLNGLKQYKVILLQFWR